MVERNADVKCDALLICGPLLTDPGLPYGEKHGDITILKCGTCSHEGLVTGYGSTRDAAEEDSEAKAIDLLRNECKKWKLTKEALGIDPNEPMPDDFLPVDLQVPEQSQA